MYVASYNQTTIFQLELRVFCFELEGSLVGKEVEDLYKQVNYVVKSASLLQSFVFSQMKVSQILTSVVALITFLNVVFSAMASVNHMKMK
jgi:hypothetical protein